MRGTHRERTVGGFEFPPGRSVSARHRTGMPLPGQPTRLWGNGAIAGPRDPLVPVKIDVHPDTDPALFVCQNPETVLQTGRSAPGGQESHRNRCAGPISGGRLADLSFLRGGLFWLDIEPEFHFLGNPPDRGETHRFFPARPPRFPEFLLPLRIGKRDPARGR